MMANLYFASKEKSKNLSYRHGKGELYRIRSGIYIDSNDEQEITRTVENNWPDIAAYLFNNPIAVARTAATLKPADGRLYFVSGSLTGRRIVNVRHLSFVVGGGDGASCVEPFTVALQRSSPARYCLENLAESRGDSRSKKTLGAKWVESELLTLLERRGENALNALRDDAATLAPLLNLEKEFKRLSKMVSAILATHPAEGILQTARGLAQAKGEPFDLNRLDLFQSFANYLRSLDLSLNPYNHEKMSWKNLSFFESYFSNYIEGTKFTIDEAEEIVFEGKEVKHRHEDSHDVSAHMAVTSDLSEMYVVPSSAEELIDLLKVRHHLLMAARESVRPGQFKEKVNRAGNTDFVAPEHVEGTLVQGFEIYSTLPFGLARAIYMHFLVSECHPFDDGNGRVSRVMMNAELVSQDQFKIIVPTVHRDSYLLGQRNATRQGTFRTIVKVLHQLQSYTASLNWSDYGEVRSQLQCHAADQEEGLTVFNKVLSQFKSHYPVG